MRKLTMEEQQIVEDNHNLIYAFLSHNNLVHDEYYGLIAESLCRAVKSWDKSKGSLSTLFNQIARRDLYKEWRKQGALKRAIEESELDEELVNDNFDLENELEVKELIEELLQSEYGEIIKLRLEGYNQKEIADILGIAHNTVNRKIKEVGEKYFNRIG